MKVFRYLKHPKTPAKGQTVLLGAGNHFSEATISGGPAFCGAVLWRKSAKSFLGLAELFLKKKGLCGFFGDCRGGAKRLKKVGDSNVLLIFARQI